PRRGGSTRREAAGRRRPALPSLPSSVPSAVGLVLTRFGQLRLVHCFVGAVGVSVESHTFGLGGFLRLLFGVGVRVSRGGSVGDIGPAGPRREFIEPFVDFLRLLPHFVHSTNGCAPFVTAAFCREAAARGSAICSLADALGRFPATNAFRAL